MNELIQSAKKMQEMEGSSSIGVGIGFDPGAGFRGENVYSRGALSAASCPQ